MWRDINIGGVLITPLAGYMLAAAILYLPLRIVLTRSGAARWIADFPLAGLAIYIIILAMLLLLL